MAIHQFCTEDAALYGIEEAIVLWNIGFWCATNLAKRQNIHDGNVWTYNPHKAYLEFIPYLCPRNPALDTTEYSDDAAREEAEDRDLKRRTQKIKRVIKSLEDQGAIVVGNYNKSKYDRTSWYALSSPEKLSKYAEVCPKALKTLRVQKCTLEKTDMYFEKYISVPPIPDSKQQITTTTGEKADFDVFALALIQLLQNMVSEGGWIPDGYHAPKAAWLKAKAKTLHSKLPDPRPEDCAVLILRDWVKLTENSVQVQEADG